MTAVKSAPKALLGDANHEVEPVWIDENAQKDVWSMILLKNLEVLDPSSLAIDEGLASIRQNKELGRLRMFSLDPNTPKEVLEKRRACEERKRLIGGVMEAMVQRSLRVRETRSNYVISTQEDDLMGLVITNPLHERAVGSASAPGSPAMLMAVLEDEEAPPGSPTMTNSATTMIRKKREKEKRMSTVIPSMPNLVNEINHFTDEVVEGCQALQREDGPVTEAYLEQATEALAVVILFSRDLVSTGELAAALAPEGDGKEERKKEISRIGQELGSVVDQLLPVCVKLVGAYHELNEAERRSTSEEKKERLKRRTMDHLRALTARAILAHKYTEEFTSVALSIEGST